MPPPSKAGEVSPLAMKWGAESSLACNAETMPVQRAGTSKCLEIAIKFIPKRNGSGYTQNDDYALQQHNS
jgi:hypothetical protein